MEFNLTIDKRTEAAVNVSTVETVAIYVRPELLKNIEKLYAACFRTVGKINIRRRELLVKL